MPGFTGQTQQSDDAAVWVIAGLWPALTLRHSCFLPASQGHSFTHFQQTEWRDKNICLPKALYLNECTCELWFESQWYIVMPVLLNVSYFLRSVLTDHEAHLNNPSAGPILNKRTQGELCTPRFTGPWVYGFLLNQTQRPLNYSSRSDSNPKVQYFVSAQQLSQVTWCIYKYVTNRATVSFCDYLNHDSEKQIVISIHSTLYFHVHTWKARGRESSSKTPQHRKGQASVTSVFYLLGCGESVTNPLQSNSP